MKNIFLTFFLCGLFQTLSAQEFIPTIKNNTKLNYICKLHGQTRTLSLTAKIVSDTLKLDLETRGVKSTIVTLPEALKNGTALSYNQGEYAPVLKLKANETFFMVSRAAYQDLIKNNQFVYNNTTYVLSKTEDKVVINGKALETFHVSAQIDQTEMWIVKNQDFPLICKVTKNPLGINWTLTDLTGF